MCGIVGYTGQQSAEPILVDGLARLEYRGYDSAGICTLDDAGMMSVRRAVGKLQALRTRLQAEPCIGTTGIGHTRWATHGRPSEVNAHPHTSDGVTVVHNGIIENHRELRIELQNAGRVFHSETDTEIFAHLIAVERKAGRSLLEAVRFGVSRVRGAYALAVVDAKVPGSVAFARMASPLVVGVGDGEMFLASDVPAVLSHTKRFIFLEDGDAGVIRADGVSIVDVNDVAVERPIKTITWSATMAEKDGHKHFMHKEIFEQPRAVTDTLRGRLSFDEAAVLLDGIDVVALGKVKRVLITACGTSWHSGLVGEYLIEHLARLPVEVEYASEFRYREPLLGEGDVLLTISQSGETADTIAALREARARGALVLGICNEVGSTLARETDAGVYTHAGPEIGVASTKAFTAQVTALVLVALALGQRRGSIDREQATAIAAELAVIPDKIATILAHEAAIKTLADRFTYAPNFLYLGRSFNFPVALEGALKLKEISYIHAEGYPAAEMKHGPIALIDRLMPVVVIAATAHTSDKMLANIEEVRARQGRVIAVTTPGQDEVKRLAEFVIEIPETLDALSPLLAVIPLQLLAYHIALLRDCDVDKPRNLAKSVTVE